MNTEQRARLEKSIVEIPRLPKEKFNFRFVVQHGTKCGTVGCWMGWCPAVFPQLIDWRKNWFAGYKALTLPDGSNVDYEVAAEALFGIPKELAEPLFAPVDEFEVEDEDQRIHSSLPRLCQDATAQDVANMLKHFLKLVDSGDIPISKRPSSVPSEPSPSKEQEGNS